MAKINKEEQARRAGIGYAYDFLTKCKTNGQTDAEAIESLRKEIEFRNISNIPIMIPQSEYAKFIEDTKSNCVLTLTLLSMLTLHDVFEFEQEQLQEFMDKFVFKADCLITPDCQVSWADYQEIVEDECGITVDVKGAFEKLEKRSRK